MAHPFNSERARAAGKASRRGVSERTKILNALFDPEKAMQVFEQLQTKALDGDMDAIKLYLSYCFGRPKESVDITTDGDKINSIQVEVIRKTVGEAKDPD